MRIAATGWGRTHGTHKVAELKLSKALSFDWAVRRYPGKTYVQRDADKGMVTLHARSASLRLGGHYEVSVELSDSDVIGLVRQKFNGRSAAEVPSIGEGIHVSATPLRPMSVVAAIDSLRTHGRDARRLPAWSRALGWRAKPPGRSN